MTKKITDQLVRPRLNLVLHDNTLVTASGDYLFVVEKNDKVNEDDIAEYVATAGGMLSAYEVRAVMNDVFDYIGWCLSNGHTVCTALGNMRLTAKGTLNREELGTEPDLERVKLGVAFQAGESIRDNLAKCELSTEYEQVRVGPEIASVSNVRHGDDGSEKPLSAGCTVRVGGSLLKVEGDDEAVGVHLLKNDGSEEYHLGAEQIFVNRPSQLMFMLPSGMSAGVWSLSVATQRGKSYKGLLASPRVGGCEIVVE